MQNALKIHCQSNLELKAVVIKIITLLQLITHQNYPNSIYTFQWQLFFKKLILDSYLTDGLQIDNLLIQIYEVTDLNVSSHEDLALIAKSIHFKDLNLKGLNLLIAFCIFNSYRRKEEHESLINIMLEDKNIRNNIFKEFKIDKITNHVYINAFKNETLELINENLTKKKIELEYIIKVFFKKKKLNLCKYIKLIDNFN